MSTNTATHGLTSDAPPFMRKLVHQAIERAQKQHNLKEGVFYLDFQREIGSSALLPDKFMDNELHIDANLIDLVKTDEVYFTPDFTQYSVIPLEGYCKLSDLMKK